MQNITIRYRRQQPSGQVCAILGGYLFCFSIHSCRENRGTELRVTHISDGVSAQSVPLNKLKPGTSWISLSILEILILLYVCSHEAGQIKGFKLSWNVYLFETRGFLGAFNWGFLTAVRAKYKFTAKKRKKRKNGAIKDPDVTIPISWLPPLHREACGLHNKKNIFTTWSLRLFFFPFFFLGGIDFLMSDFLSSFGCWGQSGRSVLSLALRGPFQMSRVRF